MTGPIALILAIMIVAGSAIGEADLRGIIEEAERIEQEQKEQEEASEYLIAIDPGHQGSGNFEYEPIGPGASETKPKVSGGTSGSATGVAEYELTLNVSLKLRDELESRGYNVLMIRETHDVNIPNSERAKMANEADADVFIRVHANGSESSSANGAMTICQTSSNPYNSELYADSKRLSELVLDAYTEATGIRKEYVWETDTMSGINWCTVPVTIIELGYMTNHEEDRKMQDEDFQDLMVQGMADGIEAYLNEKKAAGGNNEDPVTEETVQAENAGESSTEGSEAASTEKAGEAATENSSAFSSKSTETAAAGTTASTETADVTEPDDEDSDDAEAEDEARRKEEERKKEAQAQALRDALEATNLAPARKTQKSAKETKKIIEKAGKAVLKEHNKEQQAETDQQMQELEEELNEEIGKLGGKWALYLKRMDTGQVIGINDDEKLVAASLIKLFVAGEFYTLAEQGEIDIEDYFDLPHVMLTVSDNGAANSLINACTMDKVNEFCKENGYEETELNRKMLEWNGTENYTSARDCGKMLEAVLEGTYVSREDSEIILNDLRNSQKRYKIPAGVPEGIETGNKTGELDNVDNDAAIVWSPACTYILCIMSSDTGGRIQEITKLSSMVYSAINASQE